MNAMQKSVILAGAVALALTLAGCGGKGGCTENPLGPGCGPSPSPSPATITETIVIFGNSGPIPAESGVFADFAIPSNGTVEATVDWTFTSSDVWVALTMAACDDGESAFLGSCSHIGSPNLGRSKPKVISGSAQAGTGRIWIINAAEVDESVVAQITLTRTRPASEPNVQPLALRWIPVPGAAVGAVRAFENEK
jgi:hypothetical protein